MEMTLTVILSRVSLRGVILGSCCPVVTRQQAVTIVINDQNPDCAELQMPGSNVVSLFCKSKCRTSPMS